MKWIGAEHCIVDKILGVHEVTLEEKVFKENKGRTMHTLCYKLSGKSRHISAQDNLLLESDMLLYIPPDLPYSVTAEELGKSIAVDFRLKDGIAVLPRLQMMQPPDSLPMRILFESMYRHSVSDRPADFYALYGLFYQLMEMIENISFANDERAENYQKIAPSLDYICDNLADPNLNESMLAGVCGYSIGYFRRIFTETLGLSPVKYIARRRMERAAVLLRSEFFTQAQVAQEVGFANVFYFGTAFKAHFGESPGQWRKHQ